MVVWLQWLINTATNIVTNLFQNPRILPLFGGIGLLTSFLIWLAVDAINAFLTSKDDPEDD